MTGTVKECRICGGKDFFHFLDLWNQPPANALLRKEDLDKPEDRFPLGLMKCENCALIQLTYIAPPDLLFRNYTYFSSVSPWMSDYYAQLGMELAKRLPEHGTILEIGANDGVLLAPLQKQGFQTIGIDPAKPCADIARKRGVPMLCEFFNEETAKGLGNIKGKVDVIVGTNVFAHINDLHDVIRGFDFLLAPKGTIVLEFPYVGSFLAKLAFDTVYHEHLSYFGMRPLHRLFGQHGFQVTDAIRTPVHGGSVRIYVHRRGAFPAKFIKWASNERATVSRKALMDFAAKVAIAYDRLATLVVWHKHQGARVVGYTAPAKANTFMNAWMTSSCRIELPYVADDSKAKQGLYTPGTHIPIVPMAKFRKDKPNYAILWAWNQKNELISREKEYLDGGGHFILPLTGEII